jgi:hypothetical protein
MVTRDRLDQTLGFEFADSDTSKGTIQLETINQDGLRDKLVSRNFLEQTVVGRLIEDNHVVGLILDLLGRPLLLGLLSSRGVARLGSCVFLSLYTIYINISVSS